MCYNPGLNNSLGGHYNSVQASNALMETSLSLPRYFEWVETNTVSFYPVYCFGVRLRGPLEAILCHSDHLSIYLSTACTVALQYFQLSVHITGDLSLPLHKVRNGLQFCHRGKMSHTKEEILLLPVCSWGAAWLPLGMGRESIQFTIQGECIQFVLSKAIQEQKCSHLSKFALIRILWCSSPTEQCL